MLNDLELDKMVSESTKNGYPPTDREALRHWDVDISVSATFADDRLTIFAVDRTEPTDA